MRGHALRSASPAFNRTRFEPGLSPQFDNPNLACNSSFVRQGSTRAGKPKVSAKTVKPFAGTHSHYPKPQLNGHEKAQESQN
jgi:hypothetical protein